MQASCMSPRRSHCAISSRDQRQSNLRVGRSSGRTALLLFPSVFLTKLRVRRWRCQHQYDVTIYIVPLSRNRWELRRRTHDHR